MHEEHPITIPELVPLYPMWEMMAFPYMVFSLYIAPLELKTFEESIKSSNLIVLVKYRQGRSNTGIR